MKYKCRDCKQPIESAVTPSGKFITVDAEPDPTANLTLDRTKSMPLVNYLSESDKQKLLTALDGAPCLFYRAHQCSNKEGTK